MIIEVKPEISFDELQQLRTICSREFPGCKEVKTQSKQLFVCPGQHSGGLANFLAGFSSNIVIHSTGSGAHKLVSRDWKLDHQISIGDTAIGAGDFALVLGPCAIESEQQIQQVVDFLCARGVKFVRGGAFKPRTSAYSFRGLGIESLKLFSEIARPAGLRIISEITSQRMIEAMADYVDIFQVGARNMQNFCLLHELGRAGKPVLLKRGLAATLEELLHSAEHIYASGNEDIILCERGIRSFETAYRNTLDLNAVPELKSRSHLPVLVDPSHGTGKRGMVIPLALAAIMAGADGLLVEIHPDPERAMSDGQQSLNFSEAETLIKHVRSTLVCRESLNDF